MTYVNFITFSAICSNTYWRGTKQEAGYPLINFTLRIKVHKHILNTIQSELYFIRHTLRTFWAPPLYMITHSLHLTSLHFLFNRRETIRSLTGYLDTSVSNITDPQTCIKIVPSLSLMCRKSFACLCRRILTPMHSIFTTCHSTSDKNNIYRFHYI